MNSHTPPAILCSFILVLLLAVPVLAATATCPSDCSCLLPAEAKKAGSPGYCGGKQTVCGYDAQKNEKYCYKKPTASDPLVATTKPVIMTTATTAPLLVKPEVKVTGVPATKATLIETVVTGNTSTPFCPDEGIPGSCSGTVVSQNGNADSLPAAHCLSTDTGGVYGPCGDGSGPGTNNTSGTGIPYMVTRASPDDMAAGQSGPALAQSPRGTAAIVQGTLPAPSPLSLPPPDTTKPASGGILSAIMSFFGSLLTGPQSSPASHMVSCNGVYSDLMTDPDNCGSCGNQCAAGESCTRSGCSAPKGNSGAVTLMTTPHISDVVNVVVIAGAAGEPEEPDCSMTGECMPYKACCGSRCYDLNASHDHCGRCGNACPAGYSCWYGECWSPEQMHGIGGGSQSCAGTGSCAPGMTCCYGLCWDLSISETHCGSCGTVCDGICLGGACLEVGGP